ncbi:ribonuclease Z [Clostridium grantii]|uniref:Ribonuclease Z n=1 Tax=Clostridium grantii DSM 8605 TaxID=1121316 RepID=A0A1M5UJK8_9CLOT|nr:ribonuclease Z [Clostridium grantii]SHH63224.1 RNAse Z [Clostridium grantii DSM 8605]
MVRVCLLAPGGMMPLPERFLSSAIISCNGSNLLIDCGEGTQIQLKKLKWGLKKIDAILITHFHADHVAGLPGLLSTIANSGREEPITIIGPKGLQDVVRGLTVIVPEITFKLNLVTIEEEKISNFKLKNYIINATKVDHGIDCYGYSVEYKRKRKFNREKALKNNVPKTIWSSLQKGNIVKTKKGTYIPEMVLGNERKGIKISYSTDTRPSKNIVDLIKNSDLFIGEGMYGEDDLIEKAIEYKHMLFSECAKMAKEANVNELWLTHFSPSLLKPEEYLEVAQKYFPNTVIGKELLWKEINFQD